MTVSEKPSKGDWLQAGKGGLAGGSAIRIGDQPHKSDWLKAGKGGAARQGKLDTSGARRATYKPCKADVDHRNMFLVSDTHTEKCQILA